MSTNQPESVVLPRTGDRPLSFTGTLLATANTATVAGKDKLRWFEVRVWRTTAGALVAEAAYRTRWEGEADQTIPITAQDEKGLADWLLGVTWNWRIIGYPPGAQFVPKQERLIAELEAAWRRCVGELLARLPGTSETIA